VTAPDDPTREQPAVEPTVTTSPAPGPPPRWWSAIPRHLGRARTSTVVLAVLFLAIGALYFNVKPDAVAATPSGDDSEVTEPATTTPPDTTTTPPPAPTTTPPAPTTTVPPTTTEESTTTEAPTETSAPAETTETVPPTTPETTSVPPLPTTATPTG
jgi:hypothetical protein